MNNLTMNNLTKLALLAGMLFLGTGLAQATDITGTISSTLMIPANSRLTGNVTCTVTNAPCILFGAPNIQLKLNGFIMTGNGGRASCTFNPAENGIDTNLQNNASIQGPGLVRRFNGFGVVVSGNHSEVEGVAVTSSCQDGIRVLGRGNQVQENSVSRANLSGSFFGAGISVSGSGKHSIRNNEVAGAGPSPIGGSQTGSGIVVGISAPSTNNLIEENDASGNPGFGIAIFGGIGNTVRHNQALGNVSGDIVDSNALGSNTYVDNLCKSSAIRPGPGAANICEVPAIAGHRNGHLVSGPGG